MKDLFKKMRSDLGEFPATDRYRNLKSIYWNNSILIHRDVMPLWDLSQSSLGWNWELNEDEQVRCRLIEGIDAHHLRLKMHRPEGRVCPWTFKDGSVNLCL
jgi:hypothetical protein